MLPSLLVLLPCAAASAVVDLDSDSLDQSLKRQRAFIKFFAPWCGHCKRLAPIWEGLAEREELSGTTIARVDCTKNQALCTSFGVRAFPTLIFADKGGKELRKHTGGRDEGSLAAFAHHGWRSAPLFDPTTVPPPKPRQGFREFISGSSSPFLAIAGLVLTLFGVMITSVCCLACGCCDGNERVQDPTNENAAYYDWLRKQRESDTMEGGRSKTE